MLPTDIKIGHLLRYSSLWRWEYLEGRVEGGKDRPCLVLAIAATDADGTSLVRVLPITHALPANPAACVEIPPVVKARLALDDDRSWIVLTESNRFAWPGPDLRPVNRQGGYLDPLPPALFERVKQAFVAIARAGVHAGVERSE